MPFALDMRVGHLADDIQMIYRENRFKPHVP
jgi:hypothetical protein